MASVVSSCFDPGTRSIQVPIPASKSVRVAFATTQERKTFPEHVPFDRFGANCFSITGVSHIGPGTYENEEKTNFTSLNRNKIQSTLGYSLAARTSQRFGRQYGEKTPCPTHYQQKCVSPAKFQPDYKPFLVGVSRFKNRLKECEFSPSPNTYNINTSMNQKVVRHQSFGGAPILMPDITIKSSIAKNTNKGRILLYFTIAIIANQVCQFVGVFYPIHYHALHND